MGFLPKNRQWEGFGEGFALSKPLPFQILLLKD